MSAFSSWARRLKDHLATQGASIALGQAQELLASGLGHNTLASFKQADLPRLAGARYIVISPELMHARAAAFDIDVIAEEFSTFLDSINRGERAERRITTEDMMVLVARVVMEDSPHDLKDELARELPGQPENASCGDASKRSTLAQAGAQWEWTVKGFVRCITAEAGWDSPVEGVVVFPKMGRRLLDEGTLLSLRRVGAPVQSEWDFDQGDVYWHDESD